MIHVDLKTRILPTDHRVFLARPGKGYRLYANFIEASAVGPELPRLELEPGKPLDQQHLLARLRRSLAIRGWYRNRKPNEKYPTTDLTKYNDERQTASLSQLGSVVSGYFETAKRGDLVVVPPSSFGLPAYIGEFSEDPLHIKTITVPRFYAEEPFDTRRVDWITRIRKRDLPDEVLEIIQKPNALVTLPMSQRDFFYRLAYPSYTVMGDYIAKFDIKKENFTTEDDFVIQAFFNFVAANVKSLEEGDGEPVGIKDAGFSHLDDYAPDLRTNVNSPGTLTLASSYITPLVAAALLAIALHVDPTVAVQQAQAGMILLGNSEAPAGDPCTALVAEQVIHHIRMLGLDKWPEACEKARDVAGNVGLESPAVVEQQN